MGLGKLFKDYFNIFSKFGTAILNKSDEMIGYYVFDVTDISIGFCSNRILKCLLGEGIIDEPICKASSLLLSKFRVLEGTVLWNVEAVKISPEWREVLELSDEIKRLIETKWTNNEIQEIFELTHPIDLYA